MTLAVADKDAVRTDPAFDWFPCTFPTGLNTDIIRLCCYFVSRPRYLIALKLSKTYTRTTRFISPIPSYGLEMKRSSIRWSSRYLGKHHSVERRGGRIGTRIAPSIPYLGTRSIWVVSFTSRPLYPLKYSRHQLNMGPSKYQSQRGEGRESKQLCPCRELNPHSAVYSLIPILTELYGG